MPKSHRGKAGPSNTPVYHPEQSEEQPLTKEEKLRNDKEKRLRKAIMKSIEVHGAEYDYSRVEEDFVNAKVPVTIICKEHGPFSQNFSNHHTGKGCPDCGELKKGVKKKTTEEFVAEANEFHENFFDYTDTVYTGAKEEVSIICPNHGPFTQRPDHHLSTMYGCPGCTAEDVAEREDFTRSAAHWERKAQYQQEFLDSLDRGIETHHGMTDDELSGLDMNMWRTL